MMRKLTPLVVALLLAVLPTALWSQLTVNFSATLPVEPTAGYTYVPTGLSVQFTDVSGGSPTSWAWDFGDGGTSALQSPSHTYATGGSYVVCLTVQSSNGCSDVICDTTSNLVGITAPIAGIGFNVAPNPFEGSTRVNLSLEAATDFVILVSDVQGRQLGTLAEAHAFSGNYTVDFSPAKMGLGAGVYFLTLQAGDHSLSRVLVCTQSQR
jgi:hypothetical protein